MENQCLGLAEALHLVPTIKRVQVQLPWKYLPGQLWWKPLGRLDFTGDRLEPPWPDILISCGCKSAPLAVAVRRASGGKTFTVHIQDPRIHPRHFDLLAVPRHDALRGDNVVVTRGALHRVNPERLAVEGQRFSRQVAHLPRPLLAVLVGGSNRSYRLTPQRLAKLTKQLIVFSQRHQAGLLITCSRRTGTKNEANLRKQLSGIPAIIWEGHGENPYYGFLALADAVAVTSDSVSMVSEACATGKPVYIIELEGGSEKFRRFHQGLYAEGITRPFTGVLEHWVYPPLDDTAWVASEIRRRLGLSPANINPDSHP